MLPLVVNLQAKYSTLSVQTAVIECYSQMEENSPPYSLPEHTAALAATLHPTHMPCPVCPSSSLYSWELPIFGVYAVTPSNSPCYVKNMGLLGHTEITVPSSLYHCLPSFLPVLVLL